VSIGRRESAIAINIHTGDRVFIHGTAAEHIVGHYGGAYAERAVCNLPHVYKLPASISFGQGAAMGVPYATAYRALFHRAGTRPGDIVLVHGATGGVGLAAVQIARAHGITVIGTGGSDKGLAAVRESGAAFVFTPRRTTLGIDPSRVDRQPRSRPVAAVPDEVLRAGSESRM
jgi:NADPH2:quinone reductase